MKRNRKNVSNFIGNGINFTANFKKVQNWFNLAKPTDVTWKFDSNDESEKSCNTSKNHFDVEINFNDFKTEK